MIVGNAAVLEVAQGVNKEMSVADGNKIAGRALYVGGVADAFEAHLGTDRGHGIHVCFDNVTVLQKVPCVQQKRLWQRLATSEERVRWTRRGGGRQRTRGALS